MSSPSARIVHGSFTADGTAIDVPIGFAPNHVHLIGTNGVEMTWNAALPAAYGLKRLANGTGSIVTSAGISQLFSDTERGFTLGADANLNVAQVIYYTAIA